MGRSNRVSMVTTFHRSWAELAGRARLVRFESRLAPMCHICNLLSKMEPICLLLVDAVFPTIHSLVGTKWEPLSSRSRHTF